jgi:hypothetical protein
VKRSSKKIAEQMRLEVPEKYAQHVENFEDLVARELLRAAYGEADALRRKPDCQPSKKLQGMILSFQQVF